MTLRLSKKELLSIVGGTEHEVSETISFSGVAFDSREVRGGELFIGLAGGRIHGQEFTSDALDRGAALVLAEDPKFLTDVSEPGRVVIVDNSLKAFWRLAGFSRDKYSGPLVAVVGSIGKTTTKELLSALLMQKGKGIYSLGSYNNHIGVPSTLCRLAGDFDWAVVEIGSDAPGQVAELCELVRPTVVVVTPTARVYLDGFATKEASAQEFLSAIESANDVIYSLDDREFVDAIDKSEFSTAKNLLSYGVAAEADLVIKNVEVKDLGGIECDLAFQEEEAKFSTRLLGGHNSINIAAATLAAKVVYPKLALDELAVSLKNFALPYPKLAPILLSKERVILNDSEAGDPVSMEMALGFVRKLRDEGLRVGLVLGSLVGCGEESERCHAQLAVDIAELKPVFVAFLGEQASTVLGVAKAAGIPSFEAKSPVQAAHIARKIPFDIILVKGAPASGLQKTISVLEETEGQF